MHDFDVVCLACEKSKVLRKKMGFIRNEKYMVGASVQLNKLVCEVDNHIIESSPVGCKSFVKCSYLK